MLIENPNSLNDWLINYLEPICDADPQALAKYIMALIKKDKSPDELRKICLEQLEVFLVAETSSFVEVLFETLNNKNYLNSHSAANNTNSVNEQQQSSRSPKTRNVPAPSGSTRRHHHMTSSSNKYSESSKASPPHGRPSSPRNSSPSRKRRSRSRSLNKSHKRNRSRSPAHPDGASSHSYGKTKRCRDYDEKGYCMRGNLCSYDHGVNPVILDSSNSVLGSLASTVTSVPPQTNAGQYMPNSQPQAAEPYNPEAPAINSNYQSSIPYRPTVDNNQNRNGLPTNKNNVYVSRVNQRSSPSDDYDGEQHFGNNNYNKKSNNQPHYKHQNRNQFRPNNKRGKPFNAGDSERVTLEVRKIPASLNTISNLNSHFSKFGTITNLKIGFDNDAEAALVEFSSNAEALAAYRSTEAVLNNRFIKVFWHNSSNSNSHNNHSSTGAVSDKPKDAEGDQADTDKPTEKKPIRDRLGGIAEKQASITKNAVNNLLNSGLINSNMPNQLASLMIGSSGGSKLPARQAAPASKPVFNPALLKKQYITPATTPSTSSSSIVNSTTATIRNSTTISTNSETTTTISAVKPVSSLGSITKPQPNKEKLMRKLELQKKRQEMLSTSIQQNRLLIEKLEKAKSDADKQFIRETIDKLTKQIKQLKDDMERETNSIKEETNLQRQSAVC